MDGNFHNGYEFVDLGLPSGNKWAKCNIGSNTEEGYGLYFQWGELKGHDVENKYNFFFNWQTAPFNNKEVIFDEEYFLANKDIILDNGKLSECFDAAKFNMGGKWRMPTVEDAEELFKYTDNKWHILNGTTGRLFISKINGEKLFLPAAGSFFENKFMRDERSCHIWTSNICEKHLRNAKEFGFCRIISSTIRERKRFCGFPIRAIVK